MGRTCYMKKKKDYYLALLLFICLLNTGGCGLSEDLNINNQNKDVLSSRFPITLSKDAKKYEFTDDNILNLKTIILDCVGDEKKLIYGFLTTAEFATQDYFDSTKADNYLCAYSGNLPNISSLVNVEEVDIFEDDLNYVVLRYKDVNEINIIEITTTDGFLRVIGSKSPILGLQIIDYNKGMIWRTQKYDLDCNKWEAYEENVRPINEIGLN